MRQSWQPIRALNFNARYLTLYAGYRCEVTSTWGFPQVPGNIRQATLDAIAYTLDRDVEHYKDDLGPVSGGGTALALSLPPTTAEIVAYYRDSVVG